ncbi:hypothetical protein [Aeromonas veronii]|uniref:hypothetical protein n=1 Tax=Aeromonas veronii TaxID=654 RepID=UPI002B46D435|nr:hypothetical protein [Aeromonas veronii]
MLAFFLGAGASVECGMPLVWPFTATFRENVLKRVDTKLFNFSDNEEIKERFVAIIGNTDMHYEQMVSELEKWKLSSVGKERKIVDGLIKQATECIQLLLLELQEKCNSRMQLRFEHYFGLKAIIKKFGCLDIYSLNHDLIVEELCAFYKIPLKDGFYADREHGYSRLGSFRVVTKEELQQHRLDFFDQNQSGVNLVKLHGSFDIFAIEDKGKYLKSFGDSEFGSYVMAVRNIERLSLAECQKSGVRGVNELFVNDDSGELQFLRRSLLSGGHKFSEKFEQIAPRELFEEFKTRIMSVRELVVIGYGFGDEHVNVVFCDWLKIPGTKLIVCDPYRTEVPDCLSRNSNQVEIRNLGFTDLLLSFDPEGDTDDKKQKRMLIQHLESLSKSEIENLTSLLKGRS